MLVHRHGDRSPVHAISGVRLDLSAAQLAADWPSGAGELTALGMRQLERLGRALRLRYGVAAAGSPPALLSGAWDPRQYRARSSDVHRTLQSAQSLLVGLFPPGSGPNLSLPLDDRYSSLGPDGPALPLGLQPVPVSSVPVEEDWLLVGRDYAAAHCPSFAASLDRVRSSADWRSKGSSAPVASLLRRLADATLSAPQSPSAPLSMLNVTALFDVLNCYDAHGLLTDRFPGVSREDLAALYQLYCWQLSLEYSAELSCVATGPLLHLVTDHLSAVAAFLDRPEGSVAPAPFRFLHFSGHDTTLWSLMGALLSGLPESLEVPYASHVEFELWSAPSVPARTASRYVAVLFNDHPVSLPACGGAVRCPLETFLTVFSQCGRRRHEEDAVLCGAAPSCAPEAEAEQRRAVSALAAALAVALAAVGAALAVALWRLRSASRSTRAPHPSAAAGTYEPVRLVEL